MLYSRNVMHIYGLQVFVPVHTKVDLGNLCTIRSGHGMASFAASLF